MGDAKSNGIGYMEIQNLNKGLRLNFYVRINFIIPSIII